MLVVLLVAPSHAEWLDDAWNYCTKDFPDAAECFGVPVALAGGGIVIALKKLLQQTSCCGAVPDNVPAEVREALLEADWLAKATVTWANEVQIRTYEVARGVGPNGRPTVEPAHGGAVWDIVAYMDPETGKITYQNPNPDNPDPGHPVDPVDPSGGGGGVDPIPDPDNPDGPDDPDHPPDVPLQGKAIKGKAAKGRRFLSVTH